MRNHLDTNILLLLARQNEISQKLDAHYHFFEDVEPPVLSVVSLGEIRSIVLQNGWGNRKILALNELLTRFVITDISSPKILSAYARIDAFSQGKLPQKEKFSARNMGKNDLWIAATAHVYDLTLITTDDDFDHLDGEFLDLKKVDVERFIAK